MAFVVSWIWSLLTRPVLDQLVSCLQGELDLVPAHNAFPWLSRWCVAAVTSSIKLPDQSIFDFRMCVPNDLYSLSNLLIAILQSTFQ